MSPLVWCLFFLTVCLDVWGQTAFKLGLDRIEDGADGRAFWVGVLTSPWVIGGFLGYCIEAVAWMYVLGHAPLSVVGPMAALSYVMGFSHAEIVDGQVRSTTHGQRYIEAAYDLFANQRDGVLKVAISP